MGGWRRKGWEAPACAQNSARPQVGQPRRPELCVLSRAAPRALATHPLYIALASAGGAARIPSSYIGPDPARGSRQSLIILRRGCT